MRLRDRLFLWVGALFFGTLVLSTFFEGYITRNNLARAEEGLRRQLIELGNERRMHVENFLKIALESVESQLNVLLGRVAEFGLVRSGFMPTPHHLEHGTWGEAASLLLFHRWIDFLQNSGLTATGEERLLSLLRPNAAKNILAASSVAVPGASFIWVYTSGATEPFLGVPIAIHLHSDDLTLTANIPQFYLLFRREELLALRPAQLDRIEQIANQQDGKQLSLPGGNRSQDLRGTFLALAHDLKQARGYLVAGGTFPAKGAESNAVSSDCNDKIDSLLYCHYPKAMQRSDGAIMTWIACSLLDLGVFSSIPFSAVARFPATEVFSGVGRCLFMHGVIDRHAQFQAASYLKNHPPFDPCLPIGSSLAIIAPEGGGSTLLGNALQLVGSAEENGYLTAAVELSLVAKELALSLHQPVFLVHEKRVLEIFSSSAEKLNPQIANELPIQQMLNTPYGVVPWQGVSYFYLHLQPLSSIDLHFFAFSPEAKEFAMIRSVKEGTQELVGQLSSKMRELALVALAISLFILYRVARRITGPISLMAQATDPVAAGKYEEVHLPEIKLSNKDEVGHLYRSFSQMVEGIKEKERVKGILNKVVSLEIAQEILRQGVSLGGEEKVVTVLFADIRGFTKMTQHLPPQQVVQLLNRCMTKVSAVIDQYHGVIDKYVGDEVMALFGAPVAREASALAAVQAGLALQQALEVWNQELTKEGHSPVRMGVGIHTGLMLAGNMGAENRLNYTVLGSNVNLAARVCEVAGPMQVLITEETLSAIGGVLKVRKLPLAELKGFDAPVSLYEVIG